MTKEQAAALGYRVVMASAFEAGLLKGERGVRTWWASEVGGKLPALDHPLVMKAIEVHEEYEKDHGKEQA